MRYGEIITLGRHKLMCGDATLSEDVMRLVDGEKVDLVLTDPPYGIKSVNEYSKTIGGKHASNLTAGKIINARKYAPVIGDKNTNTARKNYEITKDITGRFLIWGGQNFTDFLPPSYGWLFWDKEKGTDKLSFSDGELAYANVCTRIKFLYLLYMKI